MTFPLMHVLSYYYKPGPAFFSPGAFFALRGNSATVGGQSHVLRCTPRGRGWAGGLRPPDPAGLKAAPDTGSFAWILPFSILTKRIGTGGTVAG
jgi:hypothetical protein